MHVRFPFGFAQRVPDERLRSRVSFPLTAYGKPLDALAIQAHVEVMRRSKAENVIVELSPQANLDNVFAVDGKQMADRDAAPRPEGEVVVSLIVLRQHLRNLVGLEHR